MGTGVKMLGGNLRWTSIQSRGSSNTLTRLHAKETRISSGSVARVRLYVFLPYAMAESRPVSLRWGTKKFSCPSLGLKFS